MPHIVNFVNNASSHPTPVDSGRISTVVGHLRRINSGPHPGALFRPNRVIHIGSNPFTSFGNIIRRISCRGSHLGISISVFNHTAPMRLSFDRIRGTWPDSRGDNSLVITRNIELRCGFTPFIFVNLTHGAVFCVAKDLSRTLLPGLEGLW